jgi:efflux transporter, outer membrane factor (OMF) lipoprotein, NodT family
MGLTLLLGACAMGPKYHRPALQTPVAFKEEKGWVATAALPASAPDRWWEVFGDATLNTLEPRVAAANQSLRAAYYAYQQALAQTQSARAAEFPTLGADVSASRAKSGGGTVSNSSGTPTNGNGARNTVSVGLSASWAPDLWGRVRRQVESSTASAEASAADLAAAQLSLQTTLAQNYFTIRQLDSQAALAADTVAAYEKSLQLVQNRYNAGVVSQADVAQAQTQLAAARVQLSGFGVTRAALEHAIAVSIGEAPANFSLPALSKPDGSTAHDGLPAPQAIPAGLPSQLLLRRPDLSAAERRVAAANAQIGVAESAYFPDLTLSAAAGYRGSSFANLLSAPNLFWSLGPALAQTLFDGGARRAQVAQSKAAYQQTVAQYRQASLVAMQQVEDQLAALSIYAAQAQQQAQLVASAQNALRLIDNQYKAGTVPYLNLLSAQTALYSAQNGQLQNSGQRLTANVALIQALGGNWGDATAPALGDAVPPTAQKSAPELLRCGGRLLGLCCVVRGFRCASSAVRIAATTAPSRPHAADGIDACGYQASRRAR